MTEQEAGILAMVRLNQMLPKREIRKTFHLGRWRLTYQWRSAHNLWGRFGGGWQWKLGIQAGHSTVIISLLVCSLSLSRFVPAPPESP